MNTNYAKTTMLYGNQWDEVMSWLKKTVFENDTNKVDEDSSSWGNFSNSNVYDSEGTKIIKASGTEKKLETGITTYTMRNNIYDLAGNCWEWIQEADGTGNRIQLGGDFDNSGSYSPASARTNANPYKIDNSVSSRPALYIK